MLYKRPIQSQRTRVTSRSTRPAVERLEDRCVPTYTITGLVAVDPQIQGAASTADPPVANQLVYIDLNDDGKLQPGDPTAVTNASGDFSFTGLAKGGYILRVLLDPGTVTTNSSGNYAEVFVGVEGYPTPGYASFGIQSFSSELPMAPFVYPFNSSPGQPATNEINAYYLFFLNRGPSDAETAYWVAQLQSGVSLTQVASDFVNSTEYESNTVASYYENYLGRKGSPSEIASWVSQMQGGMTEEQVAQDFLTSPEFNNLHSSSDDFVQTLYQDVLSRQATSAEVAVWDSQLNAGTSRSVVVSGILDSSESQQRSIDGDYTIFLGREPLAMEAAAWQAQLAENGGPLSLAEVATAIGSSPEFQARADANA
jgi:hypothetical protein